MGERVTGLQDLGREIAKLQDHEVQGHVERAAGRLFDETPARPSRAARRAWVLLAAAVLTLLVAVVGWPLLPRPVTFEVESRPGVVMEGRLGHPLDAPTERELALRFSDGTTVLLAGGAHGRVNEATPTGARMQLVDGRVAVSVPPKHGAKWTFDAGPFAVKVTGTRFDVSWDRDRKLLDLTMHDGSVKVTGPTISGERNVVAGQSLRISLAEAPAASKPSAPEDLVPDAEAVRDGGSSSPKEASPPVPSPTLPGKDDSAGRWRALAARGAFKDALAAVEPRFDDVCRTGSADEVVGLGDIARYAGDAGRARVAYLAARTRFARTLEGARASFSLGRMAFESGNDAEAITWFETYLQESATGPLAREALGRLLEAHQRRHDDAEARRLAAAYLQKYPDGPHAKLARSLTLQ